MITTLIKVKEYIDKVMPYVYIHTRLDNKQVFYVGIGKAKNRVYSKNHRNNLWYKIVNKHGYEYKIIYQDLTWEEAQKKSVN